VANIWEIIIPIIGNNIKIGIPIIRNNIKIGIPIIRNNIKIVIKDLEIFNNNFFSFRIRIFRINSSFT